MYSAAQITGCKQPMNAFWCAYQVDIFSLGVIIFELFLRKPMAAILMEMNASLNGAELFAYKVSTRTKAKRPDFLRVGGHPSFNLLLHPSTRPIKKLATELPLQVLGLRTSWI